MYEAAASTGNSLGPSPGSLKKRAGIRITEVFGNSGAVTWRPGRREPEGPQGLVCMYLALSRLSRPVK